MKSIFEDTCTIHTIECVCNSPEHAIRIVHDKDDNEVHLEVFLNHHDRWYHRVVRAVKYVFGYKCKYGHWDCTIFPDSSIQQLKGICDEYESRKRSN